MPIFVELWGGLLAILPQLCAIFNFGEMNLDHDFFQVSKLSEDEKSRSSQKEGKLCSPNCSGDLRSNALQNQIIGGMQIQTILKLLGEIQSNYWGGYISPSPLRVSTPLSVRR